MADENEPLLDKEKTRRSPEKVPIWTSCRYGLAIMSTLGFLNAYTMRVNLTIALVAMVNHTQQPALNGSEDCIQNVNITHDEKPAEFGWDATTQNTILGAFYYGYIFTQIPAGWLAGRFGGKLVFGLGILFTAVFTLLTPLAARTATWLLIAVRVAEGLAEGVLFPAMHAMWRSWAPPIERSKLVTISLSGGNLGIMLALPVSGIMCQHFGWPVVFYAFGTLGCLWFVAWMFLVYNSPRDHPRISHIEREYIEQSLLREGTSLSKTTSTPWLSFATSVPVWGLIITHICFNWGTYTLSTNLPTYMKEILLFDLTQDGFLSALPYLCMWLVQVLGGQLADKLREQQLFSTAAVRKLFNSLGMLLQGVFLVLAGYVSCHQQYLGVLFLTVGIASSGLGMSGFQINHLDIAPRHAGVLMGITNCIATVPGFAGPAVVGFLTKHAKTWPSRKLQWQKVFYIAGGIYAFGTLTFLLMGRGTVQEWAKEESEQGHKSTQKGLLVNQDQTQDDTTIVT
ncbi:sialin-like [Branchiostoma floridae x Branchiostoma japonicum]